MFVKENPDRKKKQQQHLIKKREDAGIKHVNNLNAFIECSNTMYDIYENANEYNLSRRRKILILFDDMIAGIMKNKESKSITKEFFTRCRKLNISLVLSHSLIFLFQKM